MQKNFKPITFFQEKLFLINHFGALFAKHDAKMTYKEAQPNSDEFLAK